MKEAKEDLRIIKTKQNIRSAFMKLMKEQPIEKIRVNDICDKALCSRNTFYQHYIDKYDLYEKYVWSVLQNWILHFLLKTWI